MNCADVDDTLDARAAGLLESHRDRELTEHVDSCADCGARAQRLSRLEDALRRPSELQTQAALRVPPLRARLQAGLLTQRTARPARESRWKLLLVAASLTVCLLLLKFIVSPAEPARNPAGPRVQETATPPPPPKQDRAEPTLEMLVARLADERPEVRMEALLKLVDLGPSILPRLRTWPRPEDAEARGLLADAVRRLEVDESVPPFVGITLDASGSASDVLQEVAAKARLSKETFHFQNAGGDRAAVTLKDATLLQAIDEVCRNTFALSYKRERKPGDQSLTFVTAAFRERPTAYVRHYEVQVTDVRVPKPGEQSNVPCLDLEVTWSPGVRPCSMTRICDLVISDDQGRVLNERMFRRSEPQFFMIEFFREHPEIAAFRFPEEGTRSLTVRGRLEFRYPKERDAVVFSAPSAQKGTTIEVDGLKATLKDFKHSDRDISFEFETVEKPDPTTLQRISRADVEAVTESGERLSAGFNCGTMTRGNTSTWVFKMRSSRPEGVREIRIPYVRSFCTDRADFEIKGIPYPK